MRKSLLLPILTLTITQPVYGVDWFDASTPLTQAHQHLLEDNLPGMFESLVEVWQSEPKDTIREHLNSLLIQSLNRDCGKSLTKRTLPNWLTGVKVIRQTIQSPGRDTYRLVIDIRATLEIKSLAMRKWVDRSVSSDSHFTQINGDGVTNDPGEMQYQKRYNLTGKLDSGLYQLVIQPADQEVWSGWVILGEPIAPQYVRWSSKENWSVEKVALNNPYCPLPEMNVGLYDYVNGQYQRVWNQTYESDYPNSLDLEGIPNERYVLAVSMNTKRWQGQILVEQSQTISRTYDITQE
ncbi:DUF2861 family protein [Vibrio sp. IRLE0018]|uniref:DUF2861 family protein n=1 Tax=Vibrio TaxID=662 RepID=UPI001594A8BD|nr:MULTISPECIES: DUF2861 family protein [Vibrio]MCF8777900.1 DUF2861 family protein [Vibrio floridensis]NVC64230.1 DUF2861 family protein [Vibrio sp. 05-20-BW147]